MKASSFTFFLLAAVASAQPSYDLILKGGHVIDPKNGVDKVRDVAIRGGKIAAVESSLPADAAGKIIDVPACTSRRGWWTSTSTYSGDRSTACPLTGTTACSRMLSASAPA